MQYQKHFCEAQSSFFPTVTCTTVILAIKAIPIQIIPQRTERQTQTKSICNLLSSLSKLNVHWNKIISVLCFFIRRTLKTILQYKRKVCLSYTLYYIFIL